MLEFSSGSSNAVNSANAMRESIEMAATGGDEPGLLIFHTTMGHNFPQLLKAARAACPEAEIIGCTGSGVVSSQGVNENMRALAVMAVTGPEQAVAHSSGLTRTNALEISRSTAAALAERLDGVNTVYALGPGLQTCGDQVIAGIEAELGKEVGILGALAGDNGKVKHTFVFHEPGVDEGMLVLVGWADPSLELIQGAHHGSLPIESMRFEITKADGNRIDELSGQPAWPTLTERLGVPIETEPGSIIALTGFGLELDESERIAYDNPHILRAPFEVSEDRQSFFTLATCPQGETIVLMERNEDHIFAGVERLIGRLNERLAGRRPLAVFQSDCMARGRLMFDRVVKDEIIAKMQQPLCGDDVVPWLGVYGFGEFCTIGSRNEFHHFTTALSAVVRGCSA